MTENNEKQAEREAFQQLRRSREFFQAGDKGGWEGVAWLAWTTRAALAQQPQGAEPVALPVCRPGRWRDGDACEPATPPAAPVAQGRYAMPPAEYVAGYEDGQRDQLAEACHRAMSDADIDKIAETMPGGMDGFLKGWGWRQFARAVEGEIVSRTILAQAAPRADHSGEGASVPWDMFPAWLIDHHEGETITEEGLQHALANMLKAHPPITAPSASAGQAEKTVAAIDKALRGKVNDPEPLPKLHAHSVAGEPTTYGLVAGLLRERDALLAKVAMFDQRIVDLGVLAMETAAPAPASPAALTGIPCKAFEAAFPAAADCRNKDGYHGIMAVRMEGFAAGVEAAARALPDDRISAIYYKTVQAQRKPDAGPFHIAFARALLAASPADQVGWQPIETAPKDGTVIDLWVGGDHRRTSCYWGLPHHCCGEMGSYCDSEWHDLVEGWVDDLNEPLGIFTAPTHWMPLPPAPAMSATPPAAES